MLYSISVIADVVEATLAAEADRLEQEQSVTGLDGYDELGLHPILKAGLQQDGYGVFAEQRYPSDRSIRNHSEGERCDLVLTPDGRPLAAPDREPTLFDPPDAVALSDAFWLEVKVVGQFTTEGPNPKYSSALLSTAPRDVSKLSRDRRITHAGLLIVLFGSDTEVVDHDFDACLSRFLDRRLPVGIPVRRSFSISARIGNGICACALLPVVER